MMPVEEERAGPPLRQDRERVYLLYHELETSGGVYSYAMDTAVFGEHMALFAKLKESGGSGYVPEITFDDGHRSNYELALPRLQEHGLKARFFITAGWTGQKAGYMGWREVCVLQEAGHSIGAHGWNHRLLTHCGSETLKEELRRSRLTLEDRLGVAVTTMSLPGGRSNRRVWQACMENGYTQVFTSEPKPERDVLSARLGRLNLHGSRTVGWLERVLDPGSGLLRTLGRQYRIKRALQAVAGDTLYARVWSVMNRQSGTVKQAEAEGE